jgi:hypothetical protein
MLDDGGLDDVGCSGSGFDLLEHLRDPWTCGFLVEADAVGVPRAELVFE